MLQRCLKDSIRLLKTAEASCGQDAATQICRSLHAKVAEESLSWSCPAAQHQCFVEHVPRNAAARASPRAATTETCKAGGFENDLQGHSRCLSSDSRSPSRDLRSQKRALHSNTYHRKHDETLTSQYRRTFARSFAKASRLSQPASRAAKKVAQRLPTSRQAAAGAEESSSGQPGLTGQESNSSDAVVTQAEQSRASDVQVKTLSEATVVAAPIPSVCWTRSMCQASAMAGMHDGHVKTHVQMFPSKHATPCRFQKWWTTLLSSSPGRLSGKHRASACLTHPRTSWLHTTHTSKSPALVWHADLCHTFPSAVSLVLRIKPEQAVTTIQG